MNYLIVNHDAGGAEIISSWVCRNNQNQYKFILEGPAYGIYQRKLQNCDNQSLDQIDVLLKESDVVLTGTSGSSNLEKTVIRAARQVGKHTITFLDYWHGYKERFLLSGELCLPNELWVGDQYAFAIARNVFGNFNIRHVENPYLLDVKDEAQTKRGVLKLIKRNGSDVLYLCQPLNYDHTSPSGKIIRATDTAMLKYFFMELQHHLKKFPVNSVKIRLHPTEDEEKYLPCVEEYKTLIPISFTKDASLVDECVVTDYVVGVHTMGLVVALWAQSRVFFCIPPEYYPFALPYKEIEDFHSFLERQ